MILPTKWEYVFGAVTLAIIYFMTGPSLFLVMLLWWATFLILHHKELEEQKYKDKMEGDE